MCSWLLQQEGDGSSEAMQLDPGRAREGHVDGSRVLLNELRTASWPFYRVEQ